MIEGGHSDFYDWLMTEPGNDSRKAMEGEEILLSLFELLSSRPALEVVASRLDEAVEKLRTLGVEKDFAIRLVDEVLWRWMKNPSYYGKLLEHLLLTQVAREIAAT